MLHNTILGLILCLFLAPFAYSNQYVEEEILASETSDFRDGKMRRIKGQYFVVFNEDKKMRSAYSKKRKR